MSKRSAERVTRPSTDGQHEARPRLRVLTDDGEVVPFDGCPNCQALEDQLAGAENNVRSMRAQMAKLKREIAGEVDKDHALFPMAVSLFRYWQEKCNHPGTDFTADRMKLLLPLLKRHGPAECREAIRGAAFDPFVVTYKNGCRHKHDGWHQIFASEDKFQSFRQRAPRYKEPTFAQRSLIAHAKEIADRVLERARLIEAETDPVAIAHLLIEVDRLNREWMAIPVRGLES